MAKKRGGRSGRGSGPSTFKRRRREKQAKALAHQDWWAREREYLLMSDQHSCRGCGEPLSGQCRRIFNQRSYLWTFVHDARVEPTNNLAERMVRQAVLWRKGSFGTQSERGCLRGQ